MAPTGGAPILLPPRRQSLEPGAGADSPASDRRRNQKSGIPGPCGSCEGSRAPYVVPGAARTCASWRGFPAHQAGRPGCCGGHGPAIRASLGSTTLPKSPPSGAIRPAGVGGLRWYGISKTAGTSSIQAWWRAPCVRGASAERAFHGAPKRRLARLGDLQLPYHRPWVSARLGSMAQRRSAPDPAMHATQLVRAATLELQASGDRERWG